MQQKEQSLPRTATAPRYQRPRSSPRAAVNRRAVITMPRSGRPHPVLLVDVSRGGACVQADVQLAIGDELVLRAELTPDIHMTTRALVIGARVRRQALYSLYGLRFVEIDAASAAALQAYIGTAKKSG